MAVPNTYLTTTKNTKDIMAAIQKAGVPDKFSYDFLKKQLGFGSSSDRPTIPVLKALRFLDENGVPTDRYRRYKDPSQAGAVLAEAMRDAYADVFAGDQNAHALTSNQLKGVFARLSDKGEDVNKKMATTFRVFADMADFDAAPADDPSDSDVPSESSADAQVITGQQRLGVAVHHDVHIHLPVSTDIAVYDAIFRSLRENLG